MVSVNSSSVICFYLMKGLLATYKYHIIIVLTLLLIVLWEFLQSKVTSSFMGLFLITFSFNVILLLHCVFKFKTIIITLEKLKFAHCNFNCSDTSKASWCTSFVFENVRKSFLLHIVHSCSGKYISFSWGLNLLIN